LTYVKEANAAALNKSELRGGTSMLLALNQGVSAMKIAIILAAAGILTLVGASVTSAAEVEIKTLNMSSHGMFQFDPQEVKIKVGDTVHFVAKDKGHNVESIDGMIPDGATPFKGAMNKDLTVTFTQPGVYGFKCAPHYGMGMVGLVVVGDGLPNLQKAEAVNHPGKAKTAFATLFKNVDAHAAAQ
jgi:pseudoazurin